MGWSDLLSDIDWGGMIKTAVPAAIGYFTQSNANYEAARQRAEANALAAARSQAGNEQAARAIQAASDAAQQRYDAASAASKPGMDYLRTVLAKGNEIDPDQRFRLDEDERRFAGQATGHYGARSGIAAARRLRAAQEADIYGANRNRAQQAGAALAGQHYGAEMAGAGNQTNTGSALSRIHSNSGDTAGRYIATTGDSNASAITSNSQLLGQTIGSVVNPIESITQIMRDYEKGKETRESNYGNSRRRSAGGN